MNIAPADAHVWPGMRIHIIDIVQPPGMGMPPAMSPIDQSVAAALAANTAAAVA
jgi:hypothetical protein